MKKVWSFLLYFQSKIFFSYTSNDYAKKGPPQTWNLSEM